MVNKTCANCGKGLPATTEYFYAAKTNKDGLEGRCKECRSKGGQRNYRANRKARLKQTAAYQAADRGRTNIYQRKYRSSEKYLAGSEERKPIKKAYNQQYYKENRDYLKAQVRANTLAKLLDPEEGEQYRAYHSAYLRTWRAARPGYNTAAGRKWRAKNPERNRELSRAKSNRRRARKQANGIEPYDFEQICERDGWRCQICQKKVNRKLKFPDPLSKSTGHIIPISEGGPDAPSNVRLEHLKCNLEYRFGHIPAQLLLLG